MTSEKEELMQELQALTEENALQMEELERIRKECQQLQVDIAALRNSRSWKIGQFFTKIVRFFVPVGSKRALIFRMMWAAIRHPRRFFRNLRPRKIKKFFRMLKRGDLEGIRLFMAGNITDVTTPSTLDVIAPKLFPVELDKEKGIEDYPVLYVPQWKDPTVSIVIPVYNQFEYTYRCVESILANSGKVSYEIIIANDCSTDLTTEIEKILPGIIVETTPENLRFLKNCNNAAKAAKGKYVLFLNNDTQVQPNWLEPLVTLIESSDEIGMVGSKLIYPNGLLQEAGGILWKDGTAWNFGNRKNPEMPEYNYVKQVDYISGAAIMLSLELWNKVGGFDEHFVPAYCEDSDLAFTIRNLGYKVMYQPKSVVVHFEGISNGTDTSTGLKKYQVANCEKFAAKWHKELRKHPESGENLYNARDYSYGKKTVLMIDHYVPTFDKDAGSRTVFQYLKLFAEKGYNVKFFGDNFARTEPYTTVLQQLGVEVLYGPRYAANWKNWIKENAEHIDFVFLNRPHIAPKYLDFIRENTKAKIVYYGHDLVFMREMREFQITGDASFKESSQMMQKKEFALMQKADMSYYPSQVEVDAIHEIDPNIRVKAIPAYLFDNVSWDGYDAQNRKGLMFIGGFGHRPNVDAVQWLAKEVMPELLNYIPNIKIHILGSNAPQSVIALASENLIMEGFVTDAQLKNFYAQCKMSIVPLRYGAGIKGKVIEAMQFGMPVMTTTTGAEGITGAEDVLAIEDDAKEFAKRIAQLYYNDEKLASMSERGVSYIRENYSPANAVKVISSEFDME